MSAKRTVTCLRSPSRRVFDVRILSARCFGVWTLGTAPAAGSIALVPTGSPHAPQNLADGVSAVWHLEQAAGSAAPQSTQKRAFGGLSRRQLGHCMEGQWHGVRSEERRVGK